MSHLHHQHHEFDVCVIGGGMAGLCAAIAAARNGANTALVHDRPVLGGNASSEVRMWICGARGKQNKETGLLEEIQLENAYRNPGGNYSIWDSVLYEKARFQPGLTPLLNCSCTDARCEGERIRSIRAWQLTTQTWHTLHARQFIDCSGDSILAAVTGAHFRAGRESRDEFDENIEPHVADDRRMGSSLLIQLRRMQRPQPFVPPQWAYRFNSPEDLPARMKGVNGRNFWWIELGGLDDTIGDAETIRDELMKVAWGVWDYIKNRAPERDQASHWAIDWLGSLPGKRESRRYVGDHILTQNDIRTGGAFEDTVAFGGWPMDDHHPAGLLYPGKPTIFHGAPSPYGIPYRCLYSHNMDNLLFAGRNVSVTHAALSSTRVMGTCAVMGQAAGTAAALCVKHDCPPRALARGEKLKQLQHTLMDDDCFLPGLRRQVGSPGGGAARLRSSQGDAQALRDGVDRDREDESHAWEGTLGSPVEYRWDEAVWVGGARLVFDSNLAHDKRMPCKYPQRGDRCAVPGSLVKSFRIDVLDASASTERQWRTAYRATNNYQRLVRVRLDARIQALRLVPEQTWGGSDEKVRLFGFEAIERFPAKIPTIPQGPPFSAVRAAVDPADLAPPDSGLEEPAAKVTGSA